MNSACTGVIVDSIPSTLADKLVTVKLDCTVAASVTDDLELILIPPPTSVAKKFALNVESAFSVPTAILSGQTAGIRYKRESTSSDDYSTLRDIGGSGSLIINLPGSPRSINECLDAVFPAIPYCIELMGWEWVETKSGWKPKGK